jgi:electron transfer flavoprotein alpha subunit
VLAVLIGSGLDAAAQELLTYGVDKVYVYDHPALKDFVISPYANCFTDFIEQVKPSSILVGATSLGRSLAPKVAARVRAGLTADCTMLEMKENTDLVQIRPAFGGNIMAQIVTPNTRPQFCTVRYKIFSAPEKTAPKGEIVKMPVKDAMLVGATEVLRVTPKPEEIDISDAEIIVACGRGVRTREDLALAQELAEALGAQMACTRPLVEAGWFDPRRQIGLSGRTVKPKLIVTLGVSGSVQFAAGMRNSDLIVAVNSDKSAPIFNIAHCGYVGDLYEIVPKLIQRVKENGHV